VLPLVGVDITERLEDVMSEGCKDTLKGLDGVNLTERQRTRVRHAAQRSDLIVSALIAVAQFLGFVARPTGH
jgi:hypothetical protein